MDLVPDLPPPEVPHKAYNQSPRITSPYVSPMLGAMPAVSPRAPSPMHSPRWPPSSPRVDTISSVASAVEQLVRSGRAAAMLRNASTSGTLSGTEQVPSYQGSYQGSSKKSKQGRSSLLEVDKYLRRRQAFARLDSDVVLRGFVYNKTEAGLVVSISEVFPDPKTDTKMNLNLSSESANKSDVFQDIEELKIKCVCQISEMIGSEGEIATIDRFSVGDHVKALVISVDVHSEKVYISLNNARMAVQSIHRLGMLPKLPPKRADSAASYAAAYAAYASPARTSPSYSAGPSSTAAQSSYSFNPYDSSTANPYSSHSFNLYGSSSSNPYNTPFVGYGQGGKKKSDMLKKLHSEPLFINPEGINILLRAYNINEYGTVCERPPLDPRHNYKNLRERQNQAWARDSVNRGLALAKEGKYASAHKCYKHALEIDATFVDAFIAMGAAYVFQGRLLEAVAEFETALRVDPHNLGAQRYLEAAQQRLGIVPVRSMTQQPGYSDAMTTSASSVYGASSPGGGLGLGAGAGLGVNTGASSGAGTIGSSSSSSNSRGPSNSNMSYRENYSGGDDTNSNPSSIISLLVGNLTTSNSTSGESRVSNLSMDDQLIAERERHVRKYLRKEEKKSKKRKRSKEKKKSKKKDKKKKRKKDGDGSDDSSNSDSEDSSDS